MIRKSSSSAQLPDAPKNFAAHERAVARVALRFHSRILRHYVASKLRTDPVYPAVYELMHASTEPVLDAGCGIGLLAFYLRERGFENPIVGLDRDQRKICEANRIAANNYKEIIFYEHDVREQLLPFSGNVAVLDLLHYLTPLNQGKLLQQLARRIARGALLVLRECPRERGPRFWATYLAEKFAQRISWNLRGPLHFPSR